MRLSQEAFVHNLNLPSDYRRIILSLLKNGLSRYAGGAYFEEFYGKPKSKPFTFAVALPKGAVFRGSQILLPQNRLTVTISSGSVRTLSLLSNSLHAQKQSGYEHPLSDGNGLTLGRQTMLPSIPLHSSQMSVRFLSPLCVREHIGETDRYVTVEDDDFQQQLKRSLRWQLNEQAHWGESIPPLDSFQLIPLNMRRTAVLYYGQYLPVSIGTAVLKGEAALLQRLYDDGMCSRRNAGFGLFQVLQKGGSGCGAETKTDAN